MTTTPFSSLGISKEQLKTLDQLKFTDATPVQAKALPLLIQKPQDIIVQAQTGTGKTAAFTIPLLHHIIHDQKNPQGLILVPTRELAIQVQQEILKLKGNSPIKSCSIYGGQNIGIQIKKLKKGVHIVVGTPGRIIDHLQRKTLNLTNISTLVLDEADEMLNMGFIEPIETILSATNSEKNTLLFSATMPKKIQELAKKYMHKPSHINIPAAESTLNNIDQQYYCSKSAVKNIILCKIIEKTANFHGIVFCETKRGADDLFTQLHKKSITADVIHGDIHQRKRERVTTRFKAKQFQVLIATDVAARGVHVDNLTHVINYNLPKNPDIYTHRIGRTGRAGNKGIAISLITPAQQGALKFIAKKTKSEIKRAD